MRTEQGKQWLCSFKNALLSSPISEEVLLTQKKSLQERVGAQAGKCHLTSLAVQFPKYLFWEVFHYLTFSFLYRVYIFLPNYCWFSPQLCLQKPFVKLTGKDFLEKGGVWIQKCWTRPLNLVPCSSSSPWEWPEEMPLPGFVTSANGFFPLCVGVLRIY